jgi:3-phenylpropionate/trans-cinnamate dioxygenase ferredoxin subunit
MARIRICDARDIPIGGLYACHVHGVSVCLARTSEGAYFAVDDLCSHEGAPLSDGELVGNEVECPLHGARFSLLTGEATDLPATEPVRTFGVVVRSGGVFIDLSSAARPV